MAQDPNPEHQSPWSYVSRHPLWSSVLSGLILAVIFGLIHLAGSHARAGASGGGGSATNASTGATSRSASAASSADSGSSPAPTIRFGPGPVRFGAVDLDPNPPQTGAGGAGDVGFYETNSDPGLFGILSTKVALWRGSGEPTEQDCTTLVQTQGVSGPDGAVPVSAGSYVCVISDRGRTARLKISSASLTGQYVLADTTVWELPQ